MIFPRLPLVKHIFRRNPRGAAVEARVWRQAFVDHPGLGPSLIRLSGLMVMRPERLVNGEAQPDPIDPLRMAHEQGQRDFAITLLALGGISISDLNQLIEETE